MTALPAPAVGRLAPTGSAFDSTRCCDGATWRMRALTLLKGRTPFLWDTAVDQTTRYGRWPRSETDRLPFFVWMLRIPARRCPRLEGMQQSPAPSDAGSGPSQSGKWWTCHQAARKTCEEGRTCSPTRAPPSCRSRPAGRRRPTTTSGGGTSVILPPCFRCPAGAGSSADGSC
jgi:hypothetical protein